MYPAGYHATIPVRSVVAPILLLSEAMTLRQLVTWPERAYMEAIWGCSNGRGRF